MNARLELPPQTPDPARVYAQDKITAMLCRRMQQNGFRYDVERAKQFEEILNEKARESLAQCDAAVNATIPRTKSGGLTNDGVAWAFCDVLKAPVLRVSEETGKPSFNVEALRAYATLNNPALKKLALGLLAYRNASKLASTYIRSIVVGDDGRVHPSWSAHGAVSGRFACGDPNLMNLPTGKKDPTAKHGGIRSLYIPADADHVIIAFDKKQLEMRVAAYFSGDRTMMAACESSDLHITNAELIWPDDVSAAVYAQLKANKEAGVLADEGKAALGKLEVFRDIAKSSGFAVCYLAEANTVWQRIVANGLNVKLSQIEAMLAKLRTKFARYYEWQERRLLEITQNGGTVTEPVLGRSRFLGPEPSPTEAANFPIQSGAAAIMNMSLPKIEAELAKHCNARLVAQVHDAGVFDVPRRHAGLAKRIILDISNEPVTVSSSGEPLTAVYPVDLKESERWK